MKVILACLFFMSFAFADIEPLQGYSQCLSAINNLRVIDVKMSEGDVGAPSVRATLTNGNNGYFQYSFTQEHIPMGLALTSMIERKAGNYQKKVNVSCRRTNGDYVVTLNLFKTN